ncbi:putative allantoin catabolism protein [Ketogulonicigenium vulgare Y25]|uniref:Allantoin catabolism protein n=1 Tax=Ketogulonicigenium vulgare (strain WSH-001) TaxID=759362 RepID=F9Y390_KETVW|nr:bifunctional allantoicase/(S)-ureidoglycine aminohydrolase [Ketogulonicigenium vulgare]ADO42123.1 putative allantoin catabolism protein [Ketogulonicigenium vulgare Y25]AEM40331.1 Allantoin catabolism protein [Ketogulonicigenium vulgare WSH-001]ALJ80526.1 (S)-ureidoglycine aminohydrolase [Ketogulonicigenium vulgare]AOZ54043.1 allantoin catabolism protein [Ketogulonicigenium vulgare]
MTYAFPPGGMPPLSDDPAAAGAVFTPAYAFIPGSVMRDIVASLLPGWEGTRAWIIARPLTGFAETFAQYAVEVAPGGGSDAPEPDAGAEGVLFVAAGEMQLTLNGALYTLTAGGYAYLPPGAIWSLRNTGGALLQFHWVRKRYEPAPGLALPDAFVTSDTDNPVNWMPGTDKWGTTRFVEPSDLRHDMHVNIVTFHPGGRIPFAETHIMEHGLYVLEGTAEYLLNKDWVKVQAGDFMWLRAWCPQACIATGDGPFRYMLYKDVNRHPSLTLAAK